MKKFIQSKFGNKKTVKENESTPVTIPTSPIKQASEVSMPVVCMDCGNRTKLFYDLSAGVADEGDETGVEGYDLGEDKDPIRCVLCRKFSKYRDNEPIQCEDCETNATIFFWTGKYNDVILCAECKEDGGSYDKDDDESESEDEDYED